MIVPIVPLECLRCSFWNCIRLLKSTSDGARYHKQNNFGPRFEWIICQDASMTTEFSIKTMQLKVVLAYVIIPPRFAVVALPLLEITS